MKKRLISAATTLGLVVSLATTGFAANFRDTEGHWAEDAINRWSSYGVVEGTSPDTFNPGSNMTRAEAAQVFVNLLKLTGKSDLGAYTDVSANAWYADALSACVANGILTGMGDGTMNPNGTITREQFFTMFARALGIPEDGSLNRGFADAGDISDWARGSVYALINRGFINGMTDSTIAPQMNINRASVMALLDQSIVEYITEDGTSSVDDSGIVLVLADEVTISGNGNVTVVAARAGSNIAFRDMNGDVEITVIEDDVTIANAPEGTTVTVAEGVTGTTVNGQSVDGGEEITIQPTGQTTGGGSSGGNGGGGTGPVDPGPDEDEDKPTKPGENWEWNEELGAWETPEGVLEFEDGSIEFPDGSVEVEDGNWELPDGTIVDGNGNVIEKPDTGDGDEDKPTKPGENWEWNEELGAWETPDGVLEFEDGSIEFPDGSSETEDGNWELPDGTIVDGNGNVVEEAQ